jgi:multicomponent Na+:H+ antiporter subunit A
MELGDEMADVAGLTVLALSLPFAGALAAPPLTRSLGSRAAWLLALAPLLSFSYFASLLPQVAAGHAVTGGLAWVPSLDLRLSWYLDGLALTFGLLITGIGGLIIVYSGGYLKGRCDQGRFLSFIFLFMGSMLGLVVSDSFLMLFVFWELTSITSFLLIGFDHEREAARRAAFQALVVTGGGGLALLAGLLLATSITGTSDLSGLLAGGGGVLRESPFYPAVLILVLGGAFTKSAQFPFHFWLPNAMEAPTPVSAYLHSATMVKAGVYLLMRLNPVMGATPAWETLLPVFGALTLITGAVMAIGQTDLKLQLAYTTVSSLGLLVLLTGLGSPHAAEAASLYLVAHALFKGALFMIAGILDHETGTRDITLLGGLQDAMPLTFAAAMTAAFSMGGLPPAFGFLAKEEIYGTLSSAGLGAAIATVTAICANALMFAIAFAVALKPFAGQSRRTPKHPHEAPPQLLSGPVVLAVLGVLAAIFSGNWHYYISSPMAAAVKGSTARIDISLAPHVGLPLALSILTILLGAAVYWRLDDARRLVADFVRALPGPDRGFDHLVTGLVRLAHGITGVLQPGRLRHYVTVTFILVAAMLLSTPIIHGELPAAPNWPADLQWHEAAVGLVAIIGLGAVIAARDRLTAIVSLGIQGFAVAMIFLLFGAPDLAFTQFMVETLSVVILALVMTRLKLSVTDRRPAPRMVLDALIAIACAAGFTLMLMKSTQQPFDGRLTAFFNQYSKQIAHGENVVNVIIVDFRGTDTLGEIAVVTITGLAILALIGLRTGTSQKRKS